jgi:uncharacterized protein YndB with AHSA1/START domain
MTMTAATNDPTDVAVDPDVPLVRISRAFNAPVDKVFRAHTDADLFVQWHGPRSTQMRVDHHNCRTAGSYRYAITHNGFDAWFRGCFHDVRSSELIVQTFTFEGVPDGVALEKLRFEDLGGRTRLVATSLVDSFAARDAFVAGGMETGVREGYVRLDKLLTR